MQYVQLSNTNLRAQYYRIIKKNSGRVGENESSTINFFISKCVHTVPMTMAFCDCLDTIMSASMALNPALLSLKDSMVTSQL